MSEELKPCPHCGGLGILMERTCNPKDAYDPAARAFPIVRCDTCHAEACGGDWQSIETAIEAWNRRASPVPGVGGEGIPLAPEVKEAIRMIGIQKTSDELAEDPNNDPESADYSFAYDEVLKLARTLAGAISKGAVHVK